MNAPVLGLIILSLAVAAGLYLTTHDIGQLRVNLDLPTPSIKNLQVDREISSRTYEAPAGSAGSVSQGAESQTKVRIDYLDLSGRFNDVTELVLYADYSGESQVNITGWTVRSEQGLFTIPQAQSVYTTGGNQKDIILGPGESAHFYSGRGTKGNFRLNKCIGYLEDIEPFTPSLPQDCPDVQREDVKRFSSSCQSYALDLQTCEHPSSNPPVPYTDFACREFLHNLNYSGCVAKHRNDLDFLGEEWWIWLEGQINIFHPTHDKVQLLDKQGKIIDEYVY